MKRYKRLYLLLGVLAVACIATFGVLRFEEHQEQIKNSDEIILKVPSDTVTSLSWEYQEESLSFHKEEVWLYDEDEAFPVSEEKINGLLAQFEEFGASFIIENVQDYGQYGLDVPVCTIRFSTDEQEYEVQLGDYSSMDSERYVSIGDGNVYLVQNDPLDQFDAVLSDMIDHDDVPRFDAVASIQFSGDETYSIVYEEGSDQVLLERLTMDTTTAGIARHHDEVRILFVHQLPYAGHPDIEEGGRLDGSQKRLDLKSVQVRRVFLHRQLIAADDFLLVAQNRTVINSRHIHSSFFCL